MREGVPKLAGVVSWGVGCGEYFEGTEVISPGVYAQTSSESARKWITDTIVSIGAGSTGKVLSYLFMMIRLGIILNKASF